MNLFYNYVNQWYRNRLTLDRLLYCQIHVTKRCQNQCTHCYFRELSSTCYDMPIKELIELIEAIRIKADSSSLIPRIDFTGGDPLLYPFIDQAAEACNRAGIQYGFKCNPESIITKKEQLGHVMDLCSGISLSIDGLPNTHDSIRGYGSFNNTLKAIEILKDSGIQLKISTTVSYDNLGDLIPLMEFLRHERILVDDYTWARYWSITHRDKILSAVDMMQVFEELSEYYEYMFSDKSFYVRLSDGRLVPQIMIGFKEHQWYPFFVKKGIIDSELQHDILSRSNCINCTATKHYYIIDPDFTVYKCRKLPETKIDLALIGTQEGVGFCNSNLVECRRCIYYNACGGCAAISKSLVESMFKVEPLCPYQTQKPISPTSKES